MLINGDCPLYQGSLTQVFPSFDYFVVSLQKCSSNQVLFRQISRRKVVWGNGHLHFYGKGHIKQPKITLFMCSIL